MHGQKNYVEYYSNARYEQIQRGLGEGEHLQRMS
jgi:hypothetical protein